MSTTPKAPDEPVADSAWRLLQLIGGGIVLCFVWLVVYAIFIAGLDPGTISFDASLQPELDRRGIVAVRADLNHVVTKARLYACGHDGKWPPPDDWVNAIDPSGKSAFVGDPPWGAERRIAMNIHLAGKTLDEVDRPERTVLFFEAKRGSPLAGGPKLLQERYPTYNNRPEAEYLIAFVDGHVDLISKYKVMRNYLVWDARESQDSPVVLETPRPE